MPFLYSSEVSKVISFFWVVIKLSKKSHLKIYIYSSGVSKKHTTFSVVLKLPKMAKKLQQEEWPLGDRKTARKNHTNRQKSVGLKLQWRLKVESLYN